MKSFRVKQLCQVDIMFMKLNEHGLETEQVLEMTEMQFNSDANSNVSYGKESPLFHSVSYENIMLRMIVQFAIILTKYNGYLYINMLEWDREVESTPIWIMWWLKYSKNWKQIIRKY